ncbi:MAG: Uncharacterized protein FD161_2583 [Limisphaerales bacterium]|nr:MAG: Uncharacterized protein FD161_2583 [Limisphaerales bacterium]KAG0508505.1 MAG: Uncharacterized protein E1N63_2334 [Limisphaerales bacterium]TXT48931.1 MAG: Uncharacterized protein FD140_3399 [Limisphaerales bacterium]
MRRFIQKLLALGVVVTLATSASAFSLMGPFATWQTAAIGYNPTGIDVGGPMNLGEDYRVTVPVLNYGFDPTFLNFFGSNGVVAIEAAMAILNAVPAASAMSTSLAEFPQQAIGPANATAASLQVRDLKSAAMSTVLGQLGLASPERWTYTLRDRAIIVNTTNYTVIQRNFDPVNWRPTNVVNGVLYTYNVTEPLLPGNYADALETRVSGNINNVSVSSVDDGGGLLFGQFFTSLTRDDYGALRYLLRFNNVHTETLPANITLVDTSSPYAPFLGTNITNLAGTNIPVATARRPGIQRVQFNPIPLDSLLGVTIRAITNQYVDTYYDPSNAVSSLIQTNQTVQRVITIPDILFTAADLPFTALPSGDTLTRPTSTRWVNNAALPGNTAFVGTGITSGPGVIPAAVSNATAIVITFNTLGPSRLNFSSAGARFLDERSATLNGVWGYFDATTIYSVFPDGLTIQDLERQLLGR